MKVTIDTDIPDDLMPLKQVFDGHEVTVESVRVTPEEYEVIVIRRFIVNLRFTIRGFYWLKPELVRFSIVQVTPAVALSFLKGYLASRLDKVEALSQDDETGDYFYHLGAV